MTFVGAEPESMDRMAMACLDGAKVLTEQIWQFKMIKPWLFGPSAVVAIGYLRGHLTRTLERIAEALREMATVLTKHAEAQRRASTGESIDFDALPQYQRRALSPEQRAVMGGVVQSVGGLVQIGGAVFAGSSGIGIPAAAISAGLGADNLIAGARGIIDRKPHDTGIHQLAEASARLAGASDRAAWWIGFAADTGAGVGTGAGSTFLRGIGLSEEAAKQAKNTLIVGTRGGRDVGESVLGHNYVGSRVEPGHIAFGGPEAIGDLRKRNPDNSIVNFKTRDDVTAAVLRRAGISVREVEVLPERAVLARQAMGRLEAQFKLEQPKWSWTGPNCTTAACDVLEAGGVDLPLTARAHPWLLDRALREFPYAGGPGSASVAGQAASSISALGSRSLDKADRTED